MERETRARQLLAETIWEHLGQQSHEAAEPLILGESGLYEHILFSDEFFEDAFPDGVTLADVTVEEFGVIGANFTFGAVGDGSDWQSAYDLGDGFWYVLHHVEDLEAWLEAVIPQARADEGLAAAQRCWLGYFGNGSPARSIWARDVGTPWFGHAMVDALRGEWVGHWWGYVTEWKGNSSIDGQVFERWQATVESDPFPKGVPPGLSAGEESPEFDAWLDHTTIRWRDTQQPVTREEARRLRLVCQYLSLCAH